MAIGLLAHVETQVLHAVVDLVPIGQRLLIDGANPREPLLREIACQRAADKSAGPRDDNQIIFLHIQDGMTPRNGLRN